MLNDTVNIRLKAIELAINRLACSISASGGSSAENLLGHIQFLKELMDVPDLSANHEAIFYRTVMLLDPLSMGPWEK